MLQSHTRGKRNATSGSRSTSKVETKTATSPVKGRRYARNERTIAGKFTSRRYGPDNADLKGEHHEAIGIMSAYTDFSKMEDNELSRYAVMHWNHRFPEGESRENMMEEIQRRMDTRRHARYA
jgi:hypothetical protein